MKYEISMLIYHIWNSEHFVHNCFLRFVGHVANRRLSDAFESLQIIKGYNFMNNDRGSIPINWLYSLLNKHITLMSLFDKKEMWYSMKENYLIIYLVLSPSEWGVNSVVLYEGINFSSLLERFQTVEKNVSCINNYEISLTRQKLTPNDTLRIFRNKSP